MTGTATVVAAAAVSVVVYTIDPESAEPALMGLFWAGFSLMVWGFLATLLILARQSITQAVWVSLVGAFAVVGVLIAHQRGVTDPRLLGVILLATLCVSVGVWWRLRPSRLS